jgi:hypothetical protein
MDREDGLSNVSGGSEEWELKFKYWPKCSLANPLIKKTFFKWESNTSGKLDYYRSIFRIMKPSKLPLLEPSKTITCFSLRTNLSSMANKALWPIRISTKTTQQNLKVKPKLNFPKIKFKRINNIKIHKKN